METAVHASVSFDVSIPPEVRDGVLRAIAGIATVEPETLGAQTHLVNDLNFDSLDMVEAVMQIEDALGISVPDDDAENIKTVGDAMAAAARLRAADRTS